MSRLRAAGALALAASLIGVPTASAEPAPNWNGWYRITFHTDQKTGTSTAARQSEEAYTAWYNFGTDCSSGTCVASVLEGPAPKDNASQATKFDWTGTQWSRTNTWRWDCLLPDRTITFDPASSVTTYTPQADGSLTGTFSTNIGGGACEGTVYIPLTATPGDPDANAQIVA
ncbi:MAG: hypothetical protein NTY24_15250 [Mycobacterium sp.]|jgi:hypothetical protein|nr:hypothetical protein [Mycobacterium sp.]